MDIFFDDQPFDLKITYLPRGLEPSRLKDPRQLAVWMYENQGAQRFGADNRLFVILYDPQVPERSWELKRDFGLVFRKIDHFFDSESVSEKDEIVFNYSGKTHTTVAKVLIVSR